jgi:hypothetical protein
VFSSEVLAKPDDPLLHDIELSLKGTYFPVGFPVRITTNSRDVLDAASESWGMYQQGYAIAPFDLRFAVQPDGDAAEAPQYRSQGRLFSAVSDRHNHMVFESEHFTGYCFVSEKTAADHLLLRMHFLEAMVYILLAQRYLVPMHAACVANGGSGVLLCGPSTAGKTTLSFGCARAGWTYVSDDCTWLLPDSRDRIAIGKSHIARFRDDAPQLFPELQGYVSRPYPNGKLTVEVPMADLPKIQTSRHCSIDGVVLIDRRSGAASLERADTERVLEKLLSDMPSYGEEVNAMYTRTIQKLAGVPAYRLRYEVLDEAIRLLEEL